MLPAACRQAGSGRSGCSGFRLVLADNNNFEIEGKVIFTCDPSERMTLVGGWLDGLDLTYGGILDATAKSWGNGSVEAYRIERLTISGTSDPDIWPCAPGTITAGEGGIGRIDLRDGCALYESEITSAGPIDSIQVAAACHPLADGFVEWYGAGSIEKCTITCLTPGDGIGQISVRGGSISGDFDVAGLIGTVKATSLAVMGDSEPELMGGCLTSVSFSAQSISHLVLANLPGSIVPVCAS